MNRTLWIGLTLGTLLAVAAGCLPGGADRSAKAQETAIAQGVAGTLTAVQATQDASPTATWTPSATPEPTLTPTMTSTPRPTSTPTNTPTPRPTSTPTSTPTPRPTSTPTPTPRPPEVKQIGPIWDSLHDAKYTMEVTLQGVRWSGGDKYSQPKVGNIYAIVDVQFKNLGPSTSRYVGMDDLQVLDANGRLIEDDYETLIRDCDFETVDLIAGGSAEGCFLFEVPTEGRLELIYAPYRYEGLEPGRYLSFVLRE